MIRKLALALSLCLLTFSALCAKLSSVEVKASNGFPVRNLDTGLSYGTIQEAIDASETSNGHTIFVNAGTYYENVVVNKAISLIGEDKDRTIVDGNGSLATITIASSGVSVSDFAAVNSYCYPPLSQGGGGLLILSSNVQISDVTARNNNGLPGIHVVPGSHDINITCAIIIENGMGLLLNKAWKVDVRNTTIANNEGFGIAIHAGEDNNIAGNNITKNQGGIHCESTSALKIRWNDIYNNGANIETANQSETVDAVYNYWGNGSALMISGNVLYNPWLTESTLPFGVIITSPKSGFIVGLTVTIETQTSDLTSISTMEFYMQDALVCVLHEPPYQWAWDTTKYPNGEYTTVVKAYDNAGNVKTSTTTITVRNVESPWWQTHFWTIIEVLIAVGSLTLGIVTFLTAKTRKKRSKREVQGRFVAC